MSRVIPLTQAGRESGEEPLFERIAVVGFGLIGGSIALACRARWPQSLVIAVDRKDVVETAMRMHAADVGGDDLVMAAEAELVVLAAPVRQNISVLESLADHVPGAALVTDVGSTKRAIVDAAKQLPSRLHFIGGHPLAGAATAGVAAARGDLFTGRPWILTPAADAAEEDVRQIESFVRAVGGNPSRMDPDDHDRLVAYLSHLPQLAVSTLLHVIGERVGGDGLTLAGRGLRDTTRLASSPAATWRDIAATNADALGAAIDELIVGLQRLKKDLPVGEELQRIFESAGRWKQELEKPDR